MPKMKHCPFCFSLAKICYACGEFWGHCTDEKCGASGPFRGLESHAVEAWNTRPDGGDSLQEACRELIEELDYDCSNWKDVPNIRAKFVAALAAKDGE